MGQIRPHCHDPWANHGAVSLQELDIKRRNVQNVGLGASVDVWTASGWSTRFSLISRITSLLQLPDSLATFPWSARESVPSFPHGLESRNLLVSPTPRSEPPEPVKGLECFRGLQRSWFFSDPPCYPCSSRGTLASASSPNLLTLQNLQGGCLQNTDLNQAFIIHSWGK